MATLYYCNFNNGIPIEQTVRSEQFCKLCSFVSYSIESSCWCNKYLDIKNSYIIFVDIKNSVTHHPLSLSYWVLMCKACCYVVLLCKQVVSWVIHQLMSYCKQILFWKMLLDICIVRYAIVWLKGVTTFCSGMYLLRTEAELLYCWPDCPSYPAHLNNIGWAIWAAIKNYSLKYSTWCIYFYCLNVQGGKCLAPLGSCKICVQVKYISSVQRKSVLCLPLSLLYNFVCRKTAPEKRRFSDWLTLFCLGACHQELALRKSPSGYHHASHL